MVQEEVNNLIIRIYIFCLQIFTTIINFYSRIIRAAMEAVMVEVMMVVMAVAMDMLKRKSFTLSKKRYIS